MKDLIFLFANFPLFLVVYAAVLVDALVTITLALIDREVVWSRVPDYLKKIIRYTGFLIVGNLVNYLTARTGQTFEVPGFMVAFGSIMSAEIGSFLAKNFPKKTAL
jgi:hypothetical protein